MSVIQTEEIAGAIFDWHVNSETVCVDCLTEEDWKGLTESQILFDKDLEDEETIYFCDRCEKKMG